MATNRPVSAAVPAGQIQVLRRRQVQVRLGLSTSTIYARMNPRTREYDPTFPKPIPLGGQAVGWLEHEVDAWLDAQIAKRAA